MTEYDVGIIGAGPGGYVAALRAAQLGLRAVVFEQERVGGLCLNWGCIPSKAILKNAEVVNLVRDASRWGIATGPATFDLSSAIKRSRDVVDQLVRGVEGLLAAAGVTVITGAATIRDINTISAGDLDYSVRNIIIATGAGTRLLPTVPVDGQVVITSREALSLSTPPKRAVIIGAGPVGVEFAHIWASYGSAVTIVEMLDAVVPQEDIDVSRLLRRSFEARGITILTATRVNGVTIDGGVATVAVDGKGGPLSLEAEVVLLAIGFVPHTAGLNLEGAGVATERGFISIDDQMRTNVPGIYAIGDVTGKLMLAHVASQQGVVAVEQIAGKETQPLDYRQMPRATFSQPEVASIGYTERGAKDAGLAITTGRFPLSALGKAIAIGETEGFVKVVAEAGTGQIVGIHMIGHGVNELLGEATVLALLEATTRELGLAVHAHPTLSEALKEAALAAHGEAIHIARRRSSE